MKTKKIDVLYIIVQNLSNRRIEKIQLDLWNTYDDIVKDEYDVIQVIVMSI